MIITTSVSSVSSSTENLEQYLIDPSVAFLHERNGGRGDNIEIITLSDGTQWVPLLDSKVHERFCGFLFLKKALEEAGRSKVKPADNKLFFNGKKVLYLSRYCGEKKMEGFKFLEDWIALVQAGFTDTGESANMRIVEGELRVFDTEKASFDPKVHGQIDAMEATRAKIEALLLSKVETKEEED